MKNKVCLITGATSEIGKEISKKFAKNHCDLILHYHTKKEEVLSLKETLEKEFNITSLIVQANLEDENSINNMINLCYSKFSQIDFLINNACACIDSLYEEKNKDNFLKTINVNLIGPFLLSKKIGDIMYQKNGGSIVFMTSTNGIDKYFPMSLDYDASKASIISLMHNLAVQYAPKIRVNAVAPGWVATKKELTDLDEEYIKTEQEKIFLNRFAQSEEIANVVYFLCSNEASYVNNTVIRVDGGTYNG